MATSVMGANPVNADERAARRPLTRNTIVG
jgi:hypothetical protein